MFTSLTDLLLRRLIVEINSCLAIAGVFYGLLLLLLLLSSSLLLLVRLFQKLIRELAVMLVLVVVASEIVAVAEVALVVALVILVALVL